MAILSPVYDAVPVCWEITVVLQDGDSALNEPTAALPLPSNLLMTGTALRWAAALYKHLFAGDFVFICHGTEPGVKIRLALYKLP